VRGLHDASRPLTVVLPGVGLVAAAGGAAHTGSFFMRVYETVTMHLHERTANSLLRAQAIVDTVTAGKMAAVAASAAAVAGGGFAVEGAMRTGDQRPGAIVLRDAQDLAAVPIARRQRPQPATHTRAASKPRAHAKPHVRARRRASAPQVQQQAAPPTTTTVTTSAPRATVASAGGSARSASSAAGEFGFEGP
jgi:hypothetical protein